MGLQAVRYVQATCDFPIHVGNRPLPKDAMFHRLFHSVVVCNNCWDNLMTVESLLALIQVPHAHVHIETIEGTYHEDVDGL